MTIILFIIILAILILVHEFGHFIVAKKTGMRVDEFGLGFPPRLFAFKKGETEYSINAIPLGGFVKIFGEDPDDESISGKDSKRSMVNKPKWAQAITISAGVVFNIIFAWILISIGFMVGLPTPVAEFEEGVVKEVNVVIVGVLEESPAFESGLKVGDKLLFLGAENESVQNFSPEEMVSFISSHGEKEISILYKRGELEPAFTSVIPTNDILKNQSAIGITVEEIGIAKFGIFKSFWEGLKTTLGLISAIAVGLAIFVYQLITGTASFSQVAGPVGIVGMVGDAAQFGFIYLLSFTAFISINLAVINSIPFPALDGGRFLFILIETIMRKNIKPVIANTLNLIGFVLLIGLMVAVTYNDVLKLF